MKMIKNIIFTTLFAILLPNLCYANWIKQEKESQLIVKTGHSSFNTNQYDEITKDGKTTYKTTQVKNDITNYNVFAEVGLNKKTSFVFNTLVSQIDRNLQTKFQNQTYNSHDSHMITNYIAAGLRRQIARYKFFASGIQVLFIDKGHMTEEERKLFGYPSRTVEFRHSLGIGSDSTFLNQIMKNGVSKSKGSRFLKTFAIIENGIRDLPAYSTLEMRNDYTIGVELMELKIMFLVQMFDIHQFQYAGQKIQSLALRKIESTIVSNLSKNISISCGIGRETAGYLNTNANFFTVGLWIKS